MDKFKYSDATLECERRHKKKLSKIVYVE